MLNMQVGMILCTPLLIFGIAMLVFDYLDEHKGGE